MRRMSFVVALLAVAGVVAYRHRLIARCEQELAIGPHAHDLPPTGR
jgi:hypothetical protein